MNLLTSPIWQFCLDGHVAALGVRDAIAKADRITEILEPPLEQASLLRLLAAVVHAGKPDLNAYLDRHNDKFELFHPEHPFGQSPKLKGVERGTAGILIHEIPTGTNINHNRQTYDRTTALCQKCCVKGMLRVPLFATDGGLSMKHGDARLPAKSPAVNGRPPVYFFPHGDTLRDTLNLLTDKLPTVEGDRPQWEGTSTSDTVGPLEAFTWKARGIYLPPDGFRPGTCTWCAERGDVIDRIVYCGDIVLGKCPRAATWTDPNVHYEERKHGRAATSPGMNADDNAVLWKKIAAAALKSPHEKIQAVSFFTNKASYAHIRQDRWDIPNELKPRLLQEIEWFETIRVPRDGGFHEYHRRAEANFRSLIASRDFDGWREQMTRDAEEIFQRPPEQARTPPRTRFVAALGRLSGVDAAALRRAATGQFGTAAFQAFSGVYWKHRDELDRLGIDRNSARLIATLYPWHPKTTDHGDTAERLPAENLNALAATPAHLLGRPLLDAVQFLQRRGIPVNWNQLLYDVAHGRHRRWGRKDF